MYKQLLFGQQAREKILKGVNIVADAVVETLGPRGNNVIFEESIYPTITKDGVTVAQQVYLRDKFENMGVMMSREAAENTNREAGDGTTTTIALLREIVNEGYKAVAAGMNPILLKRGMDVASKDIIEKLNAFSTKVKTQEQKLQVATISANNDLEMGKMIVDVIDKVGTNGVVTVTTSNNLSTEVEYVKGAKLHSGIKSHIFINDPKHLACNLNDPIVIITSDDINLQGQLVPIMQSILNAGFRQMILFANKVDGQALAFLIQNAIQGKFFCVPVDLPSFGPHQTDIIYDLAAMCEANVLGESDSKKITEATIEDCGRAGKVIIGVGETILADTKGNIKDRIDQVKALLKKEKDIFKKEKQKERLGRLTGSIASIKVGGASESEQTEARYRIEDALNATRSAIEEGIVPGGGVALLNCYNSAIPKEGDTEFCKGYSIVVNALKAPLRTIAKNGGVSGEEVVGRVLDKGLGYNALTGNYEDLVKSGIIDPTKVVRCEVQNAVATAGILLTSNVAITIEEDKKNE